MTQTGLRNLGIFVSLATLMPYIRSTRWWIRIFDFPRLQIAGLGLFLLGVALANRKRGGEREILLKTAIASSVLAQLAHIYRYTILSGKELKSSSPEDVGGEIRLLIINIYQYNRKVRELLELIADCQPDVVLINETDAWWNERLKVLDDQFPHRVLQPQEDTYGMSLYSRIELVNPQVRFLVKDRVPSIKTDMRLPGGQLIRFYGMHPQPPARFTRRGEIRDTDSRDTELIQVAREIQDESKPTIVAGDFNDVAWSYTTREFQRMGRLLDPRVGRGFYNTYPTRLPPFRYPLDQLFVSRHFFLKDFERLKDVGSDHLPIFAVLKVAPEAPGEQKPPD